MPKYINADEFVIPKGTVDDIAKRGVIAIHDLLEIQPAADVRENIDGRWILIRKDYLTADGWIHNLYKCDMCGRQIDGGRENFCPSCGAMMREREETECR